MRPREQGLDTLRAVAALAVCWYHFTHSSGGLFERGGLVYASGTYGWAGVQVFFVLSGFVLPLSMARSGYALAGFWRYIARRVARITSPYLASIAVIVGLGYAVSAAPWFRGPQYAVVGRTLLEHAFYLPGLLGRPWLNPVYWTLAIEMQFYLLIGVAYPLLTSRRTWVRASLGAFALSAAWSPSSLVFAHGPYFVAGIAAYLLHAGRIGWREFGGYVAVALGGVLLARELIVAGERTAYAAVVVAAPLALLGLLRRGGGLQGIGRASYSLYLLHVPIGGRVMLLGSRLPDSPIVALAALGLAMAASIVAALVFYRVIELPAIEWSRRIRKTAGPSTAVSVRAP